MGLVTALHALLQEGAAAVEAAAKVALVVVAAAVLVVVVVVVVVDVVVPPFLLPRHATPPPPPCPSTSGLPSSPQSPWRSLLHGELLAPPSPLPSPLTPLQGSFEGIG